MQWEVAPELISWVYILIIIIHSRQGISMNMTRDRIFKYILYVVLFSVTVNLLSTYLIFLFPRVPHTLVMGVTSIYFMLTPLMPMLYFYYTIVTLYYHESLEAVNRKWYLCALPYMIYLILVLLNPLTHQIFCILPDQGYVRQPYMFICYVVFYFYCIGSVVLTLLARKRVERSVLWVLLLFPCLSLIFIGIQAMFPDIMLTGTAAFSAIFIIFLYFQNQRLMADEMTGVFNRNALLNILDMFIKEEKPLTMIVVSLKHFKSLNQKFGIVVGDGILKEVARYFKSILLPRQIYRYSGDQFAIIKRGGDPEEIEALIEKIETRFHQSFRVDTIDTLVAVDIVVVGYPDAGVDAKAFITALDMTLKIAKANEGGEVYRYDRTLSDAALRREQIVHILAETTKNAGFEVYFQPIWSGKTRRFCGAEALVRLNNSPLGPLYPDEFIPIAESTGVIVEMTYQIIEKACALLCRLDEDPDERVSLETIAINFSFVQFLQPDSGDRIFKIIQKYGLEPRRIKIEVTERIFMEDVSTVSRFMKSFLEKGICFELDDFGTGFSNLETLLKFPIDVVKLDKSVIWSAIGDTERTHFLRHLVHGFAALGKRVLAEGVEDEAQKELVLACGCHEIQGYYFSKPLPEDELIAFLKRG